MAPWNKKTETTPPPAPVQTPAPAPTATPTPIPNDTKFCERKRSKDAGFMANIKEYTNSFIHAPMDEHKACFKASWEKMIGKFGKDKSAPLEGPVPVQTTAKN